jgi:hypothetical protein
MRRRFVVAALAFTFTQFHPGSAPPIAGQVAEVEMRVTDLSPRFVRFHELATAEGADPDRRWELWREHYGFAALPPVPERDSMARALLDEAWPHYLSVMERIRAGAAGLDPAPEPILRSVAKLLELDVPLRVDLLVYVGALEKNAFFMVNEGIPTVAIPVEEDPAWRSLTLAHEFTHAVHNRLAGLSGGWERSIAETILSEGLASHAAMALFPGRPAAAYVEHEPGWLDLAASRERQILEGILPHVSASDSESVMRFTMGTGTTGTPREAYYVGWLVIEHLLRSGYDFPALARIPADAMPALVTDAIRELVGAGQP